MKRLQPRILLLAIAGLLFFTCSATAGIIFDLSPTNGTTFRSADSGPGQGVTVSTNTTITNMAFFQHAERR